MSTIEELAEKGREAWNRALACVRRYRTEPFGNKRAWQAAALAIKEAVEAGMREEVERLRGEYSKTVAALKLVCEAEQRAREEVDALREKLAAAEASAQGFNEWMQGFVETDEYKADSFTWSDMAEAAYCAGGKAAERRAAKAEGDAIAQHNIACHARRETQAFQRRVEELGLENRRLQQLLATSTPEAQALAGELRELATGYQTGPVGTLLTRAATQLEALPGAEATAERRGVEKSVKAAAEYIRKYHHSPILARDVAKAIRNAATTPHTPDHPAQESCMWRRFSEGWRSSCVKIPLGIGPGPTWVECPYCGKPLVVKP